MDLLNSGKDLIFPWAILDKSEEGIIYTWIKITTQAKIGAIVDVQDFHNQIVSYDLSKEKQNFPENISSFLLSLGWMMAGDDTFFLEMDFFNPRILSVNKAKFFFEIVIIDNAWYLKIFWNNNNFYWIINTSTTSITREKFIDFLEYLSIHWIGDD